MIKIERLMQYPLFQQIKEEDLKSLFGCLSARERVYKKGEFIILLEDEIRYIGVVCHGTVQMLKEDIWGNKTMLVQMKESDVFGETFVCSTAYFSTVSFYAAEDTEVLFLHYDKVMHTCSTICKFHHRLVENMVMKIASKNLQLMEKLEVISKKTLREKIMSYLTIEAQKQGQEYFNLPLGRVELAGYLCADRSALTRELSLMQEEGLITYDKNTFRIMQG